MRLSSRRHGSTEWDKRSFKSTQGRDKVGRFLRRRRGDRRSSYGKARTVVEEGSWRIENPGIWGYPWIRVRIPRVTGDFIPWRTKRRSKIKAWCGMRNIQSWVKKVMIATVILKEKQRSQLKLIVYTYLIYILPMLWPWCYTTSEDYFL